MPTYDYICNECGERFENFQTMSSRPLAKRPNCEEKNCNVTRVISGGSGLLIFKGSGFYLTDYKDQPKTDKNEKETKKNNDKPGKKEKTATTSKTEK